MSNPVRQIIKHHSVVSDDWNILRLAEGDTPENVKVGPGKVIVPLKVWQAQAATLQDRPELGVWLASDEDVQQLKKVLHHFALIAIDFPKFTDGRGYSLAYNLRTRLGYRGELRAIGDVLRDQMFYLQRVGFDAFAPRPDRNIDDALKGLADFSEKYQASWDEKLPLASRVQRAGLAGVVL